MDWPRTVTIIEDRYHGTYSGGDWLAFEGGADRVDEDGDLADALGNDPECCAFFPHEEVAVGSTATDALLALIERRPHLRETR